MSFNAKNLSYEKKEPSFLRKLRGEFGEDSGARHQRPLDRPVKPRLTDTDDGPTYVVEGSNEVISKEDYEEMVGSKSEEPDTADGEESGPGGKETGQAVDEHDEPGVKNDAPKTRPQQNVAGLGGSKKRKQAKVVSDETPNEAEQKPEGKPEEKPEQKPAKVKTSRQKSKQKKRIKLSFEDDSADA